MMRLSIQADALWGVATDGAVVLTVEGWLRAKGKGAKVRVAMLNAAATLARMLAADATCDRLAVSEDGTAAHFTVTFRARGEG